MLDLKSETLKEAVLSTAVCRAAEALGLSREELARVLGVSDATVSSLFAGSYALPEGTKAFELGALFVRLFRSLDATMGGDGTVSRKWMRNNNLVLAGVPADHITTITGLTNAIDYLDSRRARF